MAAPGQPHTFVHPECNVLLFASPAVQLRSVEPAALPPGCLLFEGTTIDDIREVSALSGAAGVQAYAVEFSSLAPDAAATPLAASVLQCLLHQWRSVANRYACAHGSFGNSVNRCFPFGPVQTAVAHLRSHAAAAVPAWHHRILTEFLLALTRAMLPPLVPDEELIFKSNLVLANLLANGSLPLAPTPASADAPAADARTIVQQVPQARSMKDLDVFTKELLTQNIAWEFNFTPRNALAAQFTEHTLVVLAEGDLYTCAVVHALTDAPDAIFLGTSATTTTAAAAAASAAASAGPESAAPTPAATSAAASGLVERVMAHAVDADTLQELTIACAVDSDNTAADTRIAQLDVVVVDCSGSMGSLAFPAADRDLKRSDAAQILFNMIVDKYRSMELHARVACVLFGSSINEACQFTDDLATFETLLGRATDMGCTALWDAIARAVAMLSAERTRLIAAGTARPDCVARVIAVTDGQDNESRQPRETVARMCRAETVIVDAFMLGNENDEPLRSLAHSSGGHTLAFRDLQDATDLFEQPFVVDLSVRLSRETLPPLDNLAVFADTTAYPRVTSNTARALTAARPAGFVPSSVAASSSGGSGGGVGGGGGSSVSGGAVPTTTASAGALRRLTQELATFVKDARTRVGVLAIDASNMLAWRVLLAAPAASRYAGCYLVLSVDIPPSYPFSAPRVGFASSDVFHPQIASSGRACVDDSSSWSPTKNILDVIADLMAVLAKPDVGNAVNSWASSLLTTDPTAYQAEIDKRKPNLTLEKARELSDDWTDLPDATTVVPDPAAVLVADPAAVAVADPAAVSSADPLASS